MWIDWIPAAVVVALITGFGTVYGIRQNRKTAVETNKVNESDALIKNLSAEVKRQDVRLDKLEETIEAQGEQIRNLQTREWGLRRYVQRLIDFIKSNDLHPPDPPHDLNL